MPGFSQPLWLLGLGLLPVLWYSWRRANIRRRKDAIEFSQLAAVKSVQAGNTGKKRLFLLFFLPLLALGCLFVALADPYLPLGAEKEGVNVILAIDNSGSMQASDYDPTRLDAAKSAAKILIMQLSEKDLAGIVIFESGASTAAYLTPDKGRVVQRLDAIGQKTGQTALGDGLMLAVEMADSIPNARKMVILLSDGVSNAGVVRPLDAARFAKERGIPVFTVGLGSDSPVAIGTDAFGNPEYAELDEETLRQIAAETGGRYFTSVDETTLAAIYLNLSREIVHEPEETSIRDLFLLAAVVLLVGEFYLRFGKGRILP